MDATLLRMAIAATGADARPLAADEAWCKVTAAQAERVVHLVHERYRPEWRPFLLQLKRHLDTAPAGTATLLSFEVPDGEQPHQVLLIIEANTPCHRLAFLAPDDALVRQLRTLCRSGEA